MPISCPRRYRSRRECLQLHYPSTVVELIRETSLFGLRPRQRACLSNMPGGHKFAGGRRRPPVVIGGHCRTVSNGVHH
jgi:hypothetical protein